ncbi:hypothetical protein ACFSSC_07060 [Corynebacterium mendelii]|uniref:Abi-like protein n=1 Tax=Corynebacterium mendelii TaxID=2765362 RepID=A0A939E1V2_9CORY|nr:hypothetical protein [Corynebacterium mendelii]MBN9644910.1 hypothetical protein [Corynebacterium mendelii]
MSPITTITTPPLSTLLELAPDHMDIFLEAAGGNRRLAAELFSWDRRAAASVQHTCGIIEIIVRSRIDSVLTAWAVDRTGNLSADWMTRGDLPAAVTAELKGAFRRAGLSGGSAVSHRDVIAHCSFGFWRMFTQQRFHHRLWLPAAHRAFPAGAADLARRRQDVNHALGSLQRLRNDAAHLTPLFDRDLAAEFRHAHRLARWISPAAAAVVETTSTLTAVHNALPLTDTRRAA